MVTQQPLRHWVKVKVKGGCATLYIMIIKLERKVLMRLRPKTRSQGQFMEKLV